MNARAKTRNRIASSVYDVWSKRSHSDVVLPSYADSGVNIIVMQPHCMALFAHDYFVVSWVTTPWHAVVIARAAVCGVRYH